MEWAAIQDWMCGPFVLAKTGHSLLEHQMFTINSWCELNGIAPDVPWVPVLQGWELGDYLLHADLYLRYARLDLTSLPVVGLGSACRRQGTAEAAGIVAALADRGIRIHGFGMKTTGLARYGRRLASSDSMAWSFNARRRPPLPGHRHKSCANCMDWAVAWRDRLLAKLEAA
jgi:hypothetical protein